MSRRSYESRRRLPTRLSRLPIPWRVAAGQGPLGWYRQCPGDELTKCLGWGSNHFNFVKLVQPRVHVLCEFCLIIRIPIACNFASYRTVTRSRRARPSSKTSCSRPRERRHEEAARGERPHERYMNESRPKSERVDLWQWSRPSSHGPSMESATTATAATTTRSGRGATWTKICRHTHA